MILSDREMYAALQGRAIQILPLPDPALFTSTALDLTLDKQLLIWSPKEAPGETPPVIRPFGGDFDVKALMNDPNWATKAEIDLTNGFQFDKQGQFILACTQQKICLPLSSRSAARVEGKSSLARLGIGVHVTAPTIHAGFGFKPGIPAEHTAQPIQLEMSNISGLISGLPVILDVGMPICQLILEEVREVPIKGYGGRFNDQPVFAVSPPASPSGGFRKSSGPRSSRRPLECGARHRFLSFAFPRPSKGKGRNKQRKKAVPSTALQRTPPPWPSVFPEAA